MPQRASGDGAWGNVFLGFLYHLRDAGLKVSVTEWMALMRAVAQGHGHASLTGFYHLARALLVKKETHFDLYDRAFAQYFEGLEGHFDVDDELLRWLEDPVLPRALSATERAALEALDLEELRRQFEERMRQQKERHDGGNHWIGTGGTSPFGHGGYHPGGIRVGGGGGGRSAVQVAGARRFANLRSDRVLDTRQLGAALRRLRRLSRDAGEEELDIEASIDKSARNGGEIELAFAPPRHNRVKLLLLMDVGGSMDPHTELCERLFSAAHGASHFQQFRTLFFHNCVYERLYDDISCFRGPSTGDVLKGVDQSWSLVLVGDAWMSPYELVSSYGSIFYGRGHATTGLEWLQRLRRRIPHSVWLNPEPQRVWSAQSIAMVRRVFPMFELTLDGLTRAVDALRAGRCAERVG